MTIEITPPKWKILSISVSAAARSQTLRTSILQALRSSTPTASDAGPKSDAKVMVELFEPDRGLYADGELKFQPQSLHQPSP